MNADFEAAERDVISGRAAQWLVRLSEGKPADRAAFVRWLKKSPRHVEEFLLMSAVCKGLRGVEPGDMAEIEQLIAESKNTPPNVVPLTFAQEEHDDAELLYAVALKPSVRRASQWLGIAAGAAFLTLCTLWAMPWITARINTYSTAVGEQRNVRLPDGSVVYMNARSRLTVNYSDAARDVELLSGEAIFKVERAPHRPFRVHAAAMTIQAVGTQFNVYRRAEGDTIVSVIDGAVRLTKSPPGLRAPRSDSIATLSSRSSESSTAVQLIAGEEAQAAASGEIVKVDRADLSHAIAWRERRLVFREDRLQEIAEEFARYSPRHIVLEDETAREKRITGTFDADDPASLVQFLEELDELTVERTSDKFVVRGR